jgi:hypothetical protein
MLERIELIALVALDYAQHLSLYDLCWIIAYVAFLTLVLFLVLPSPKKTISELKLHPQPEAESTSYTLPVGGVSFVISDEIPAPEPSSAKYQGPMYDTDQSFIPVSAKASFLAGKERELFQQLERYAKGKYLVIPNVTLARLVQPTEKSVSVHLLKRLRSNGVHFVLVERFSLKAKLAICLETKLNADSLIFVREVLAAAKIPFLCLQKDSLGSYEDIEGLLHGKLLPEAARLSAQNSG